MEKSKLENIEAIAFLTLISITGMIFFSSQALIITCSSASLITALVISVCAILFCLIIGILNKNFPGKRHT